MKKNKEREKKPRCYAKLNSKFLSQSGITFTLCYTFPFHHPRVCHAVPLPKSSPFPCMDPTNTVHVLLPSCNFHQQSRENLLSSLGFYNNQYTYILPEFLPIFFSVWWSLFLVLGRDTSKRTEVMGQPFQGSFKSSFLGLYWWFSG